MEIFCRFTIAIGKLFLSLSQRDTMALIKKQALAALRLNRKTLFAALQKLLQLNN